MPVRSARDAGEHVVGLRVGIDVGGTFTDVVALDESGSARNLKVPTTPREPQRAVIDALRPFLEDDAQIEWIGHATTIATNALLGQMGLELPRVLLVTTEGFRDVIEIGRQNRSRVYDLFVERPKALVAREDRLTVRERLDFRGETIEPLDDASLDAVVRAASASGARAVAVCLLHSYANDAHERQVAQRLRDACDAVVLCSSGVNPEYREYERFSTTVVSAALAPIVGAYLEALERELRVLRIMAALHVMRSDGGLSDVRAASSRPASLIESGPASGVIAAAHAARTLGVRKALCFDMGGTTAKAGTVIDGVPEIVTEYEAAGATHSGRSIKGSGYPVRYPFVDLCEVSAGGGTIAWIDEARALRVGPLSAGADPGPACYGRSERATVTDANVVLGRLHQTHLLGGTFPIDARRSHDAIASLARALDLEIEETAAGIVRIIDAQMAKVLRIVTVERGLNPRDFTMIAFGGNGPLHACELAEELGVSRVLIPKNPGTFSAHGLLVAELSVTNLRSVLHATSEISGDALERLFSELEECGRAMLAEQGAGENRLRYLRRYDARYRGQSFELQIEFDGTREGIERRFHDAHRTRYGYAVESEVVELVNARSTVIVEHVQSCHPEPLDCATRAQGKLRTEGARRVWIAGNFADVPVYRRESLAPNAELPGPAIVEQYDCTTYVKDGWTARTLDDGFIAVERSA